MFKIQTMNKIADAGIEALKKAGCEVGEDIRHPSGLLLRSADLHDMCFPESLLAIARAGAGYNNIPVERCTEEGIAVFNAPGANAQAVKEQEICSLVMASRDILGSIEWVKSIAGEGEKIPELVEKNKANYAGPELLGKTLGVIGLGAIGVLVANAAISLGMNVVGYDPMISVEHAWKLSRSIRRENSLENLLGVCDVVTVHVPLKESTRGMIGRRTLNLCRRGVRILNFSRAGIVDDAAMIEALGEERVAMYVTDFPTDALIGVEGVICLPHLGASTPESKENSAAMAAAQTRDFIEHGIIRNSVNLPTVDVAPASMPRLLCIHENVPNVLGSITSAVAGFGLNISELVNRSRGAMAVSVIDIDEVPHRMREALIDRTSEIAGMKRVRLLGV